MFSYQKNNRFFAQIAEGFEEIATQELQDLGAEEIKPVYHGLYFTATLKDLYRINYYSRFCTHILAPLLRFDCHSTKYLHKTAIKMPWEELLSVDQTFAIAATVGNSKIRHSQYAALCLKDAIVDYFRNLSGARPSIDRRNPHLWLDLNIANNKATISIDTSGGSLHRRGYRQESVEAPMQETLAAAIIQLSGWDGSRPLLDPMCGSGTLLCEALMSYGKIPAGYLRQRFGFEALPDFQAKVWKQVKKEAEAKMVPLGKGIISGSDISDQAAASARTNLQSLPGGKNIAIKTCSFEKIPSVKESIIVCNPPYGIRLKKQGEAEKLIEEFGNFLKHRCTGSSAFIYLGQRELLKSVGLRPTWKKPFKLGGLDGVLAKYDLY